MMAKTAEVICSSQQNGITYAIVDETKPYDALKKWPDQQAGPQQDPGPIHDQLGMALRTLEAMLYCCWTQGAAVSCLRLPEAS